jgi:thiol-disulfide isomerase/thioredoxin
MNVSIKKILLSVGVIMGLGFAESTKKLPMPDHFEPGETVPWFAVIDASTGYTPFNKAMLQKKIDAAKSEKVIFAYFATWCLPCAKGLKELASQQAELDKNNVSVFLIHVGDEETDKIGRWVSKNANSDWPVLLDRFEVISKGWRFYKNKAELPRTLVLDSKLVPTAFYGEEGSDWPSVLYK